MKTIIALSALLAGSLVANAAEEHIPVESLFNGQDLSGWSGDPTIWSAEDGTITGRSTAEAPLEANTFLIWNGEVADFEFRVEFKLTGETANSGVQYRSKVLDTENWIVAGYQADMDYANRYTGMLFEEQGRGILVSPGRRLEILPGFTMKAPVVRTMAGDTPPGVLKATLRQGDWNALRIVALGNHVRHYVNGVLTAESIDRDPEHAALSGILALQLHRGPPMTVQFRDLLLRRLP